ncbi:MAG: hypothetical protein M1819_004043 [Sarea resinae]|nr:MAG: hypothetical protein M1819_004043 [Sarea resinae]
MPNLPSLPAPTARPQTLRQAKRAYQKSNQTLSEAQLRRLRRDVELRERAAKIREKEERKKENKRKKEEKAARERETRRRMGRPEPVKGYVSPRQVRMSQFVRKGSKGVESGDEVGEKKEEADEPGEEEEEEEEECDKENVGELQGTEDGVFEAGKPREEKPDVHAKHRQPLQRLSENSRLHHPQQLPQKHDVDPPRASQPSPSRKVQAVPQAICGLLEEEENWDDFFASSTQIVRELSEDVFVQTPTPSTILKPTTTTIKKEEQEDNGCIIKNGRRKNMFSIYEEDSKCIANDEEDRFTAKEEREDESRSFSSESYGMDDISFEEVMGPLMEKAGIGVGVDSCAVPPPPPQPEIKASHNPFRAQSPPAGPSRTAAVATRTAAAAEKPPHPSSPSDLDPPPSAQPSSPPPQPSSFKIPRARSPTTCPSMPRRPPPPESLQPASSSTSHPVLFLPEDFDFSSQDYRDLDL